MAPGVTMKVYRVYGKGKQNAGGFAVAAAIRKAIEDGVDLINLSLYFDHDDLAVVRQVQAARANGAVCIAAAGNSGDAVKMPARHDAVLGVSAIGCRGCWPEHASMNLEVLATPRGANRKHFVARFSCTGPEIDLAGGGVGVVSLFPGNRRAIMNGTSMASPAVTGLIARRLAKHPDILAMPRDQARSDAIVKLALDGAKSLGFPRRFQGRGSLP
jgi:subtilisin family serine protease